MPGSNEPTTTIKRDRQFALALFILTFVAFSWIYGGWGANQEANFALARAMSESQIVHIDEFTMPWGDVSRGVGGLLYSNKPPGLSALAAIPHAMIHPRFKRRFHDNYPWDWDKRITTLITCGLTGALIAPLLFSYGRRKAGASRRDAALAAIAATLGTIVFPYSTILFAHVPAALFLLLALILLDEHPLLAGAAAGFSGVCFYVAIVAAGALAVLAWKLSRRHSAYFVAGGIPPAALLATYQWKAFGSPFVTSVERSVLFTEKDLFLGFLRLPRLEALWGITFSEYRGLFVSSPILLFAILGSIVMIRRRRLLPELAGITAIVLIFVIAIASFNGWPGGWAFGPRYLLPVVPLLGIPMMFAASRWNRAFVIVLGVSIAINLAATAVDPMTSNAIQHPLTRYIIPSVLGYGVPPDSRIRPYADCDSNVERCPKKSVSLAMEASNLGEQFFGVGASASIVPLAIWIALGSVAIVAAGSRADAVP